MTPPRMLDVWDATRHDDTARIRPAVTVYPRLKSDGGAWGATLARQWERATTSAGDPARLDALLRVADDLITALLTYEDPRASLAREGWKPPPAPVSSPARAPAPLP